MHAHVRGACIIVWKDTCGAAVTSRETAAEGVMAPTWLRSIFNEESTACLRGNGSVRKQIMARKSNKRKGKKKPPDVWCMWAYSA